MVFFENASALCRLAARMAVQCRARVEREMEGTQETVLGRRMKTAPLPPSMHTAAGRPINRQLIARVQSIANRPAPHGKKISHHPPTKQQRGHSTYPTPSSRCVAASRLSQAPWRRQRRKPEVTGRAMSSRAACVVALPQAPRPGQGEARRFLGRGYLPTWITTRRKLFSVWGLFYFLALCFPSLNSLCH